MAGFLADVRVALRRLVAQPGFLFVAAVSLGLGVGVNATVFAAANALLLRPMSVPRAAEIVRVYSGRHSPLPYHTFAAIRDQARSFSHLVAETQVGVSLATESEPTRLRASVLSSDAFAALEAVPAAGAFFSGDRSEREFTAPPQVVLSNQYWQRTGADPRAIGRNLILNGRPFTVVGVAPAHITSTQTGWAADIFVPLRDSRSLFGVAPESLGTSFYVSGRLRQGVNRDQAAAELRVIGANLLASDSLRGPRFGLRVTPARGVPEELRLPAQLASAFLLVLSILVLVIAATNLGNVILARNAARRRELSVRVALGASPSRLLRLLLIESCALTLLGAGVAMLLAMWAARLLPRLLPDASLFIAVPIDWRVVSFVGVVSAATLFVFGMLPARQALRTDLSEGIGRSSGIGSRDQSRLRRRFLFVQVALSVVLLTTASLFVRSLGQAGKIGLGFEPANVALLELNRESQLASPAERSAFFERARSRVEQVPGVTAATLSMIPEVTGSNAETNIFVQQASGDSARAGRTYFNAVGARYHEVLKIPLVRGRGFLPSDGPNAPLVAVVNENFAARMWPGEDPLGKRFSMSSATGPWFEVVGVSRHVKYHTLGEESKSFATVPESQAPAGTLWLEVRFSGARSIREVTTLLVAAVREIDATVAVGDAQWLVEAQKSVTLPARIGAALLAGIGVLGLILAGVGVGGVAAYTVTNRAREIGVRMALGAPPLILVRDVLRETWRPVLSGVSVGLIAALALGKVLESQLYDVSVFDLGTLVVVPSLLLSMALLSAMLPMRRLLRTQPTEALRTE